MTKSLGAVLAAACCATLAAQSLSVRNAASLVVGPVAPGSIVTILGTQLSTGVAVASNVKTPPATLGGVTVSIGGSPLGLFYVSPTQINGVVNPATPQGNETVTVTSSSGTQTGAVTVSATAPPGLFALNGVGTRDGAILNAVSFLLGAFTIQTSGSNTYLALYATGVNTSVAPTVTVAGVPVQVQFYGAASCCDGLQQVNVVIPTSLAGAGRVPIVLTSNGQSSNAVQVVLLPPPSSTQFPGDEENQNRSRELAALAYIPGTSLVLSADENDDVVRVIDVSTRKVTQVIALPQKAGPSAVAVNAAGTLAVVAETGRAKAAILDLTKDTVATEIPTGSGPADVAIAGTQAVVVDQNADSVTILDLAANTVQKTLSVGRGPVAVAADPTSHKAYVTNEDDGTVSVIDLAGVTVTATWSLGTAVRPEGIALIPGAPVAFVTVPSAGPDGQVLLLNLTAGTVSFGLSANPDRTGGSTSIAVYNSKIYFANQAGGSVSILPVTSAGVPAGTITTIKVGLGPRALTVDAKDNLLVVSNEGSGTLSLIDLSTGKVVASIDAVQTSMDGDDDQDDHSDRTGASNRPAVTSLSPASSKGGVTFTLTINGANLTGASGIVFVNAASLPGNGHGNGQGGPFNTNDSAFTVTNIKVASGGKQLTATVAIAASAQAGARIVRVATPNAESTLSLSANDTFTVLP